VSLVDVAEKAGLKGVSVYGGIDRKRFIIETNGAGVAFFDYDNDGWVDALVLSGTRLEEGARQEKVWPASEAPSNRLYRNNRDGTFTDVTDRARLRRTGFASSVCAADYDNDGWLDVFITYFGRNVFYRNRGDGSFEDLTDKAGLATKGTRWGSGCTFVDYDRDGRLDLFVANYLAFDLATAPEPGRGPNCLWKGIPVNCGPKGLPFDTNLLYRNRGDGSFEDVSDRSGVSKVTGRYSMTATGADFDDDGWPDIYVACDSTAAILYRNNRDGTFTDAAMASGVAYGEFGAAQAGMGIAVGDYDGDGRLDLLKTHFADDVPALYRNLGRGLFEDVAVSAGLGVLNRYVEWGTGLPDLDNDGRADLLYVTGNVYPEIERQLPQYAHRGPRVVFHNVGGASGAPPTPPARSAGVNLAPLAAMAAPSSRFEDVTARSGPGAIAAHSSRGAAFGDFDNDGDVDVLIMNMNEPPTLLRNDYAGSNGWLELKLEGTRSNRAGIGATVVVEAGGRRQARVVASQASYYSHDDLRAHFGLGPASRADRIEVRWPSGHVDVLKDVEGRRLVKVREGSVGGPSAP
jgi:hypothetical protein